jgi:hypothetical protein
MDLNALIKIISLLKDLDKEKSPEKELFPVNNDKIEKLGTQICILQRGWVFVGNMTKVGNDCYLDNASVIRTWGTTKGLGEIAENGPIEDKTTLDPCPQVKFHYATLVAAIKCREGKWK